MTKLSLERLIDGLDKMVNLRNKDRCLIKTDDGRMSYEGPVGSIPYFLLIQPYLFIVIDNDDKTVTITLI